MSWETYDDECEGCKPALLDVKTGKRMPDTHPVMQAILRLWKTLTQREKEGCHRIWCNNSRDQEDMKIMQVVQRKMQEAISEVTEE